MFCKSSNAQWLEMLDGRKKLSWITDRVFAHRVNNVTFLSSSSHALHRVHLTPSHGVRNVHSEMFWFAQIASCPFHMEWEMPIQRWFGLHRYLVPLSQGVINAHSEMLWFAKIPHTPFTQLEMLIQRCYGLHRLPHVPFTQWEMPVQRYFGLHRYLIPLSHVVRNAHSEMLWFAQIASCCFHIKLEMPVQRCFGLHR